MSDAGALIERFFADGARVPSAPDAYMALWLAFRDARPPAADPYAGLIAEANERRAAGDMAGCASACRRAVDLRPELPFAHARLAHALNALDDIGAAAAHLDAAARLGGWIDRAMRVHSSEALGEGPRLEGALASAASDFVVVVACDSAYCARYLVSFARSLAETRGDAILHVHLVNPDASTDAALIAARQVVGTDRFACTWEHTDVSSLGETGRRAYYACSRFMHLPELVAGYARPLLVTDVDVVMLKPIAPVVASLGDGDAALLELDPVRNEIWARFSASALVVAGTPGGAEIAGALRRFVLSRMEEQLLVWFLDQMALFAVFAKDRLRGGSTRLVRLPAKLLEYVGEPGPDTVFWSLTASVASNAGRERSPVYRRYSEG